MPAIPLIQARSTPELGIIPSTQATADSFGAPVGRAMQQLAQSVDQAGREASAYGEREQERERQARLANNTANGQVEMSRIALQARQDAPVNGEGAVKNTLDKQQEYINNTANTIKDPVERQAYITTMKQRSAQYGVSATEFEFQQNAENSKLQANHALNGLQNLVRGDPTQFDVAVEDGRKIIESRPGLSAGMKQAMTVAWQEQAVNARFDGMLSSAKTPEEFDAVEASLVKGDGSRAWQSLMKPENYDRLLDRVKTARKEFTTLADGQARVALDAAEAKSKEGVIIDDAEIKSLAGVASQSRNPITASRMARLTRDNDIRKNYGRLPPAELEARSNVALRGNTGLPTEVSSSVNQASRTFGIGADYLGVTANLEYGGELRRGRARSKPEYAPQAAGANVDVRNLAPEVADAAGLAGEIFGRPLVLSSGYRSQAKQDGLAAANPDAANAGRIAKNSKHTEGNALDISTVGMSANEKARLVDSLVQAGFTGFGEYGTHIHADMRPTIASGFNPAERQLGWTTGSPEVVDVLAKRGFVGGASSDTVRRDGSQVTQRGGNIDYGKTTQLTGPDGRPTSSAVGLFQFTKGTWLELMSDGATPGRIGLDIRGKTEAELLDMRKDPRISTMMAGALAEKNKKALEGTLGRPVSNPELYMAHFLGSAGAIALISGVKNAPNQAAHTLLPKAAEANRSTFYSKSGDALTTQQVYDKIALRFSTSPSNVSFGDSQTYKTMAATARTELAQSPIDYARKTGLTAATDINAPGGLAARAAEAKQIADYYSISIPDMKPFDKAETEGLIKKLKEGSADEQLQLLKGLQEMERSQKGMGQAAMAQIGMKDTTLGWAAELALSRDAEGVASEIVRGNKILDEDKTVEGSFGRPGDMQREFYNLVGPSLSGATPETRNAIFNAAKAHYAYTTLAKGYGDFNPSAFGKSVKAVMGGTDKVEAVAKVNGVETVLPKGVSGDEFNNAVDRMTEVDYIAMSRTGLPPRDNTGSVVPAKDIAYEGAFVAIGGDNYAIRMGDGKMLTTGRPDPRSQGMLERYIFVANPEMMKRKGQAVVPSNTPTGNSAAGAALPSGQQSINPLNNMPRLVEPPAPGG